MESMLCLYDGDERSDREEPEEEPPKRDFDDRELEGIAKELWMVLEASRCRGSTASLP